MKEYKILKPQKTNVKRVFVPKGHAVPEDILNDITVNSETTTLWEEKYGDDIINSDQITTHWTGGWNYNISELSNVQGHISIEPEYTYDFICEFIAPRNGLNTYNDKSDHEIQYLSVVLDKIEGKELYNILSAMPTIDEWLQPVKVCEFTLNSSESLSDLNLNGLEDYINNEIYPFNGLIWTNNYIYIPGKFDDLANIIADSDPDSWEGYFDSLDSSLRLATDMMNPDNLDIVLSAHSTYRTVITPKYQKFYNLTLSMDIPENSYMMYNAFNEFSSDETGTYSPMIFVMDGNRPLKNTLTLADSHVIPAAKLYWIGNGATPYKIYAEGDALSSLIVYGASSQVKINDNYIGINELMDSNINSNTIVNFESEAIGQSVNFKKIILDIHRDTMDVPDFINAETLANAEYVGTVIFASTADSIDGSGTKTPIHNAFNVPYEDIKYVNSPAINDCLGSLYNYNEENYQVDGYTLMYFINLDNPTEVYGVNDGMTYIDSGTFEFNVPTNVGLIYMKNNQ